MTRRAGIPITRRPPSKAGPRAPRPTHRRAGDRAATNAAHLPRRASATAPGGWSDGSGFDDQRGLVTSRGHPGPSRRRGALGRARARWCRLCFGRFRRRRRVLRPLGLSHTSLLVTRGRCQPGRIDFVAFYARRARGASSPRRHWSLLVTRRRGVRCSLNLVRAREAVARRAIHAAAFAAELAVSSDRGTDYFAHERPTVAVASTTGRCRSRSSSTSCGRCYWLLRSSASRRSGGRPPRTGESGACWPPSS